MKLKDLTNAAIGVIDKKLERFDPKWQAAHGKGGLRSRYHDKTGIARYREWRGVKDTMVDYAAWLNNLLAMGKMVASAPVPILKGFWEYRWMGSYLGTFAFIDRLFEGYRGDELKIAHMNMHCIVNSLTRKIALVLANDRRLGGGRHSDDIVPMDEVLPPLFMTGFPGLIPIPIQTLPEFIICDIDQHLEPYYIDVAESFGLAADVCSRCSAETGVAINDDFPLVGKAVLTTNMPCNASEATSMFQRRRFGMPDFPVTLAMIHNEPGAHPYSTQMLKDAIAFIEEQYGVTYDWNALFARAEHMNEQNRIELEKWELFKTPYSALCGIAESLYRLYAWASVNGQEDQFTKNDRKVLKLMLDAYQGHNMISTTDPEQAIQDLALFSEKGVMRHHAVGGWDNVNAVWEWASKFNCDMVIFNDNVACKGMNGVHALMEEQARDLGFHFIFLEHDLEDCRTISRRDMRNTVNKYMTVVLNEKPLDATLVDFNDSLAW